MESNSVVEKATDLRDRIKVMNSEIKDFVEYLKQRETPLEVNTGLPTEDKGEQIANAMLSYRHGEDCRMRLGKVIEATVGFNRFDKKQPLQP